MFSRRRWSVKVGQAQELPSGQQSSDFLAELYQSVCSEMEEEKRRLKATGVPASFGLGGEMTGNRWEAGGSGGEVGGNRWKVLGNGEGADGNGFVDESSDMYREVGGEGSGPSCLSSEGEREDGGKCDWQYSGEKDTGGADAPIEIEQDLSGIVEFSRGVHHRGGSTRVSRGEIKGVAQPSIFAS